MIFLGLFSAFRFLNELVRGDVRPPGDLLARLTFNQGISLALVAVALAAAWVLRGQAQKKAGPEPRLGGSD